MGHHKWCWKCRAWPREDVCAEVRAANRAKWEARCPDAAEELGGNQQTGASAPGPGYSAMGQHPPFLQPSLLWCSPLQFTLWWPSEAMGGHCGHLKPAEDNVAFWSRGQQQGRTKPPRLQPSQDLTWRTDRQQRHGAAWFGARPGTQAAKHWLVSVLKINRLSWIYF